LEALLQASAEPAKLVAASREIDRHLAADAVAFGESRYDQVRIGFVRPLGVQFEVLDDVGTVIVFDVWRIDKRQG
jgi:hypothetical protein